MSYHGLEGAKTSTMTANEISSPSSGSPNPLKRTWDDSFINTENPGLLSTELIQSAKNELHSTSTLSEHSYSISSCSPLSTRQTSPALSSDGRQPEIPGSTLPTADQKLASQKKRKLTAAEREMKQKEKEARELEKSEEKARRAQEKARREAEIAEAKLKREEERREREEKKKQKDEEKIEERRRKDDLKRQKDEARDEEKRLKEAERLRKEEEEARKKRAQLSLTAFFAKPPAASRSPGKSTSDRESGDLKVSSSSPADSASVSLSPNRRAKTSQTDYQREYLPFTCPQNSTLASAKVAPLRTQQLDSSLIGDESRSLSFEKRSLFVSSLKRDKRKYARQYKIVSVQQLVSHIQGSSTNPVDLTVDKSHQQSVERQLGQIVMKRLTFAEDVRPGYFGTYTKDPHPRNISSLARNPFVRSASAINYDYDSEAEWVEPEEGEDLDSDGEEEIEEDGEEDMDDFLDDADAPNLPKPTALGELEPVLTGICWAPLSKRDTSEQKTAPHQDPRNFRMEFLLDIPSQTIDPLSTEYWKKAMEPPRVPLKSLEKQTNIFNSNKSHKDQQRIDSEGNVICVKLPDVKDSRPKKAVRLIDDHLLQDFKGAVEGSDLTKIGLLEILKKKFPKTPKDVLRETLGTVAARVGNKEADKTWVLLKGQ